VKSCYLEIIYKQYASEMLASDAPGLRLLRRKRNQNV
jgi:hypothetical protein